MSIRLKKKNLKIAIDGPVGAGKSAGAHFLAQTLGALYVYTGAMYRAVALLGLQYGLNLEEEEPLTKVLAKSRIKLSQPSKKGRFCDVYLNGKDVTDELFTPRLHWGSSQVAVFPKVRRHLVKLQKQIASNQAVVMEGRDITTVVLPDADLKIYLTATLEVRARRRFKDLQKAGEKITFAQVVKDVEKRDKNDSTRETDPLQIAKDAWILDTSNLTLKEEVDLIVAKLKEMNLVA